jgi:GTP cyclohydrolase II
MKISIHQVASAGLPTCWGRFRILGFELHREDNGEASRETGVAVVMGDITCNAPLLRIHSQCLTGDAFRSLRCDCGEQLQASLRMIAEEGAGTLIYEEMEGRGIGLMAKVRAYELQDGGCDTIEANERLGYRIDYRDYILPVQILHRLGISRVRLITNNPEKINSLMTAGIAVDERIPCETIPTQHDLRYLQTKKLQMGHMLSNV